MRNHISPRVRSLVVAAAIVLPSIAGAQRLASSSMEPALAKRAAVSVSAPDAQALLDVDAPTRGLLVAALSELSLSLEDSPKKGRDEVKTWGADTLGAFCVQFRDRASRRQLAPDAPLLAAVNTRSHRRALAMSDCPPTPARVTMPRGVPASDSAFYVSEVARVPVPQQVTIMRWTAEEDGAVVEAIAWYEGRGRHMRCAMTAGSVATDWRGSCQLVAFVRE
jgi:hypothetical protein